MWFALLTLDSVEELPEVRPMPVLNHSTRVVASQALAEVSVHPVRLLTPVLNRSLRVVASQDSEVVLAEVPPMPELNRSLREDTEVVWPEVPLMLELSRSPREDMEVVFPEVRRMPDLNRSPRVVVSQDLEDSADRLPTPELSRSPREEASEV